MTERIRQLLFLLIRQQLCGEPIREEVLSGITQEELRQLYTVSKAHDMAHLVGAALSQLGLLGTDEVSKAFQRKQMVAVYRCEQLNYELGRMEALLEREEIPFLPLKGAVIRPMYPEAWMRTSCDIDVLVHESDLERASAFLEEELSYRNKGKGPHDVQMHSPEGVHIELHYDLVEENAANAAGQILSDVWSHVSCAPEKTAHRLMDAEMFLFYHVAHMVKHFQHGGCGIKPFLDMYVLEKNLSCNREALESLLDKAGLLSFERAARRLYSVWFCDAEHTELSKKMEEYVLSGGVYGTLTNAVSVAQRKKGGKLRYALGRIFIPYEALKFSYPILQKHKWLLPIMEVRRWGRLLFCGGLKRGVTELSINARVSQSEQEYVQEFMQELGL